MRHNGLMTYPYEPEEDPHDAASEQQWPVYEPPTDGASSTYQPPSDAYGSNSDPYAIPPSSPYHQPDQMSEYGPPSAPSGRFGKGNQVIWGIVAFVFLISVGRFISHVNVAMGWVAFAMIIVLMWARKHWRK